MIEDMKYELMSKKLNAVIPDEVWDDIDVIAKGEMRTKSQMAAILLAEAITARRAIATDRSEAPVTEVSASEPDRPASYQSQAGQNKQGS